MKTSELLLSSRRKLIESGYDDAISHVRLLIEKIAGTAVQYEDLLTRNQVSQYLELEDRLLKGEPVDYVLGKRRFFGVSLKLDNRALIPRNETEELVERVLQEVDSEGLTYADIGTGSGAIALAIAQARPGSLVYASDISEAALCLAEENALLNNLTNVRFLKGSVLDPFTGIMNQLDVIVTNPPYILSCLIPLLPESVRVYEPVEALEGGADGLAFFRSLMEQLPPGKTVFMEIAGYNRKGLARLVEEKCSGYAVQFFRDSFKNLRFAVLRPAKQ